MGKISVWNSIIQVLRRISYAYKPKSSKRPITRQQKSGKSNHSRAFNNSLRSIVCAHAQSKSDLTVGYVLSLDVIIKQLYEAVFSKSFYCSFSNNWNRKVSNKYLLELSNINYDKQLDSNYRLFSRIFTRSISFNWKL